MKSAADPYEFFRWKSSCGRLVVRTTWVKGVRHVVLSDDDDESSYCSEREKRQLRHQQRKSCNTVGDSGYKMPGAAAVNRQPPSEIDENRDPSSSAWYNYNHHGGGDDDESYVERVLQWLQKPSGMLETRRKPMSAPGNGVRRPALVKTCSIPENKFADPQQVFEADREKPARSTRNRGSKNHSQKTELHVHMPSMWSTDNGVGGKDISSE